MTEQQLAQRLREVVATELPLPGSGRTADRHRALFAIAREDVSLAKLAEAHWDGVAILAEAGRPAMAGALYGVWASEIPGKAVLLEPDEDGYTLQGSKPFCSGIGLVDRALLTTGSPVPQMVEVGVSLESAHLQANLEVWAVGAFAATRTGSLSFDHLTVPPEGLVGAPGWYLQRPGFWHGACGPAACWAGGAAGLLDVARNSKRRDPHTLAHLGALQADVWAMEALLERAGNEIDLSPQDATLGYARALMLRHSIEQLVTDCLRRFARAYGPQPLSMNDNVARRYAETDLYVRQCHGERDLQALGETLPRLFTE